MTMIDAQNSGDANAKASPDERPLEASFSTLALSIGSSAAMAMGLAADPSTGKVEKDRGMARFNIDLLRMLRDKTSGNLEVDEKKFLEAMIADLQLKFVQA